MHAASDPSVLAQWDFNQYAASGSLTNPVASTGIGSASGIGLGGSIPLTGSISNLGGGNLSSDPNQAGAAWNTTNYATQGQRSGQTGIQFLVSTLGVDTGPTISFDVRGSITASRFIQLLYTLDGTSFAAANVPNGGIYEIQGGAVFNNRVSFDLSGIAGAGNNANFGFRIVSVFAPGTNQYSAIAPGSTYGTTGTLRYDMVTVTIPSPGALALCGGAILCAGHWRRRR